MGRWSPEGDRLLFCDGKNDGIWALHVVDLKGAKITPLANRVYPREGGWTPDGRGVLFERDGITYALSLETKRELPVKEVTTGLTSPDGNKLAFTSNRHAGGGLYVLDLKTRQETGPLHKQIDCISHFAWSPDGAQLAFTSYRLDNNRRVVGGNGVFITNIDGSGLRRLTESGARQYCPVWSPDAKRIAFARERRGAAEVCVVNADGTGLAYLTTGQGYKSPAAWSPDGRHIAFHLTEHVEQVKLLDLTTQKVIPPPNPLPRWVSANEAKKVVFHVQDGQYRFDGLAETETRGRVSHDGKCIITVEEVKGGWAELFIARRDGTEKRQLTDIPMTDKSDVVWRDDDGKVAFAAVWFGPPRSEQPAHPREHVADGLYVIDADGRNLCRLSRGRSFRPFWQPALAEQHGRAPIPRE